MKLLSEVLNEMEEAFVREVIKTPGQEVPAPRGVWLKPEALGLIKRIGSGKYVPTDKIQVKVYVCD